jgi:hypothetical protein
MRSVHQKRTERTLFPKSKCHFFKKKNVPEKLERVLKGIDRAVLECVPEKLERFFLKKRAFTFLERVPFRSFL